MKDNYFVVLQLPSDSQLTYQDTNPKSFWKKAAGAISMGKAKIVSRRQDTGVSEELRSHAKSINYFSTYVLVCMRLGKKKDKSSILKKAAKKVKGKESATVIDATDQFRLVTAAP